MATIREALKRGEQLLSGAGVPDAKTDAALLLAFVTGEGQLPLRADAGRTLPRQAEEAFEGLLRRRARREPLQYITGEAPFMGLVLRAAPGALIPRFDTETLCQQALARMGKEARVLDLCTGSGALAVAIACHAPGARVFAGDVSPQALALAGENARRCGAEVDCRLGDLFAPFMGEAFDIIVSNPPYIPSAEIALLQEEVRREPALALDGGAEGLDFYRRIAREAPGHLRAGGHLLLEVGSGQAPAVAAMLAPRFADVCVYEDLNGLPRVVAGRIREA